MYNDTDFRAVKSQFKSLENCRRHYVAECLPDDDNVWKPYKSMLYRIIDNEGSYCTSKDDTSEGKDKNPQLIH